MVNNISNNDSPVNPRPENSVHTPISVEKVLLPPLGNTGVIDLSGSLFLSVPRIDYLSLTTFSPSDFDTINRFFYSLPVVEQPKRVRQYEGGIKSCEGGSSFVGRAIQKSRIHLLTQISGGLAHDAFFELQGLERCTRIDVQITLPEPDAYKARFVKDCLEDAAWPVRGVRPTLRLIEGEDGADTLYIGSRKSGRMVRIYQKRDELGKRYLRFEVELRSDLADSAYLKLCSNSVTPQELLFGEFLRLPTLHSPYFDSLRNALSVPVPFSPKWAVPESSGGMKWFKKSVLPFLERMITDHAVGEELSACLRYVLGLRGEYVQSF